MYDDIGAVFWYDHDGWRGWSYDEDKNRYYFYDVPAESLGDVMGYMLDIDHE